MATTQKPTANTNGRAVRSSSTEEDEENIFTFIPNLIGTNSPTRLCKTPLTRNSRLLSHRPRYRIPLLHAPAPAHLLAPLQRILSS